MTTHKKSYIYHVNDYLQSLIKKCTFPKCFLSISYGERRMLFIVTSLLVFLFFTSYRLLWLPVTKKIEDQRLVKDHNVLMISKMRSSEKEFSLLQKQRPDSENKNIKNLSQSISESAIHNQVTLTRIQAQDRSVQVFLEPIVFNELLSWLVHLKQEAAIHTTRLEISATEESGKVKVIWLEFSN